MIICHVITGLGLGGAERLLVNSCNLLANQHKIHVIYLKGTPRLQYELDSRITLHHVPWGFTCFLKLRRLYKQIQPDVLHTQLGHADFIGLWAATGLSLCRFCTMQNIWFKWNNLDYIFFWLYRFTFTTTARNCTVIAISKTVFTHVRQQLKVPANRVQLLYNAIPAQTLEYNKNVQRQELAIDETSFVILFVGRFRLQKSVDTLIRAADLLKNKIPNLKIILLGEGEEESKLRALVQQFSLSDCVDFRGTTLVPDVYFAIADIFVLPSIFEGLGLVVLESFRAKLPVIASDVEGPKELIKHGENGLLFTPLNHQLLADNIWALYQQPDLRIKLAENGLKTFTDKFDVTIYAQQLEKLYANHYTRS